jgi:dTDP-glucose pyrophosphorylase
LIEDWRKLVLVTTDTVADAIKVIDSATAKIALVTNGDAHLVGTVTDGDVRRGMLRRLPLDAPVTQVMNDSPVYMPASKPRKQLLQRMSERQIRQIPLVDSSNRIVGLALLDDLLGTGINGRPNVAVIMAGGLGSRLRPLTEKTPKPMLKVGNKPLLETIVESLIEHRIGTIYLSINYMADAVRGYFGDGSKWGAEIRYIEENERMGTAGALTLMHPLPEHPFLVVNGDVLTKIDFGSLLDYHEEKGARATMCVREYDFQVPFGVVNIDSDRIIEIDEKPVHRFFVNAGIYVLDPTLLRLMPSEKYFDMPDLFDLVIAANHFTSVFPIREYWLDVGQIEDFHRANSEFPENFCK